MNGHYTASALIAEIADLRREIERLKAEKETVFQAGAVCSKALVRIKTGTFGDDPKSVASRALESSDSIFRHRPASGLTATTTEATERTK